MKKNTLKSTHHDFQKYTSHPNQICTSWKVTDTADSDKVGSVDRKVLEKDHSPIRGAFHGNDK